jgi:hypothetical protein
MSIQSGIQSASYTGIHPWLGAGEKLVAELFLDGKAVAKMDFLAKHDGMTREPALKFTVPVKLQKLRLSGKLIAAKGKPRSFDVTWNVRDIATYTTPLYDTRLSFPERIKKFTDRLVFEAEKSRGEFFSPVTMKNAKPDYAKALTELEARLNIRLPQALRALSRYEIAVGDSYFVKPAGLKTVMETLPEWGYPEQGHDSLSNILSPATRARYERSILVFVDVGDGLGGLAWDPQGVTKGESSNIWVDRHSSGAKPRDNNTGVWFWLHQENLDKPELLLDVNLQPRTDENALLNAFQRFAVDSIDNLDLGEIKEPSLIIDSAHPHGFLQLHFEHDSKKPMLWLRSYHSDNYSML